MTKQGKERAGWAAILVTVLLAAAAVIAKAGAVDERVSSNKAAIERLSVDKADQREVDAIADGVRDANRRLLLLMGAQGVVDRGP